MLPKIARQACPSTASHQRAVRRVAAPACADADPEGFTDPTRAADAAQVCDRCEIATVCLLEAMQLHQAHRRGRDPWGITGCYAGVWFNPDQAHPRRIPHSPAAAA